MVYAKAACICFIIYKSSATNEFKMVSVTMFAGEACFVLNSELKISIDERYFQVHSFEWSMRSAC